MAIDNPFIVLLGKSGSGKTTIANILESEYGFKQVQSYTERPKRTEDETGHTFVTPEEFNKIENIIAYTQYGRYRYCTTKEQVESCDVAVLDVRGVNELRERYDGEKNIVVFYLNVDHGIRKYRMRKRGDSPEAIAARIQYEIDVFAGAQDVCDYTLVNKKAKDAAHIINMTVRGY